MMFLSDPVNSLIFVDVLCFFYYSGSKWHITHGPYNANANRKSKTYFKKTASVFNFEKRIVYKMQLPTKLVCTFREELFFLIPWLFIDERLVTGQHVIINNIFLG